MDITASAHRRLDAFSWPLAVCKLSGTIGKRSRRRWSPEEKRRILEEASRPGASIAEVARRYGLNANLVFAWRRILQPAAVAGEGSARSLPASSDLPSSGADASEFIPIGVFAPAEDHGPGLRRLTGPERAAVFMLALGEQYGGKVWNLLDDDELRSLSVTMSTLGTVDAEQVEGLLLEFVSRLSAFSASLIRRLGGLRAGFEGGHEYDLALRAVEQISEDEIRHIPHVLYHRREARYGARLRLSCDWTRLPGHGLAPPPSPSLSGSAGGWPESASRIRGRKSS